MDTKKIPIGKGLADRSRQTVEAHGKYQRYATDAQIQGESPKKFEDWAKESGYDIVEYDRSSKRKP